MSVQAFATADVLWLCMCIHGLNLHRELLVLAQMEVIFYPSKPHQNLAGGGGGGWILHPPPPPLSPLNSQPPVSRWAII